MCNLSRAHGCRPLAQRGTPWREKGKSGPIAGSHEVSSPWNFFSTKFTGLDVEPPGVFEFRSLRLGSAGLHQHARLVGVFLKTDVRRESVVTGTRVADGLQYEFTAEPDFFNRYSTVTCWLFLERDGWRGGSGAACKASRRN
jgi:hypothetical protein